MGDVATTADLDSFLALLLDRFRLFFLSAVLTPVFWSGLLSAEALEQSKEAPALLTAVRLAVCSDMGGTAVGPGLWVASRLQIRARVTMMVHLVTQ